MRKANSNGRGRYREYSRRGALYLVALCVSHLELFAVAASQQLIDRVVARVNGAVITLTDVEAAIGLGLVDVPAGEDPASAAIDRLIDRRLVLAEVARFTPPEPEPEKIDREQARLKRHAGARLAAIVERSGVDDARIRELARDNLRIEGYLTQRFGASTRMGDDEVMRWMRDLRARADVVVMSR